MVKIEGNVYTAHPACAVFPLMSAPELAELVEDIRAHGLRNPIVMHSGQVLDGRNRLDACGLADVPPRFVEWSGDCDPLDWVVSANLHRRHLTSSQRAMVAARLATMRQGARTDLAPTDATSQTEAAAKLDVSRRSVQRAADVINTGTPVLVAAVERGTVPVSVASEAAALPDAAQDRLVEAVTSAATPAEAHAAARKILKKDGRLQPFIDAAIKAMVAIDLNLSSSKIELSKTWKGRVWLEPPRTQPQCALFTDALASRYEANAVTAACVLVNNSTEAAWFQRLLGVASAICMLRGQGQVVIYLGKRPAHFRKAFASFGAVWVPG